MSAAGSFLEAPIPRPLLWTGVPFAAVVLITLFVFLGFPYDRLADLIAQRVSEASDTQVRIGGIQPRITIGGPGFSARDVLVITERQEIYQIDPFRVRPAWSLSWLRGQPAIYIDFESNVGSAAGTLVVGGEPGWNGELTVADLSMLPLPANVGLTLAGTLVGDADLVLYADGPAGSLRFEAAEGSLSHESLPMDLAYDVLRGDLLLGGKHIVEIRELTLDGPMLSAALEGNVTRGRTPGRELLDIDVEVQIKGAAMQSMLRGFGVALDENGRAGFSLGGSLGKPKLR